MKAALGLACALLMLVGCDRTPGPKPGEGGLPDAVRSGDVEGAGGTASSQEAESIRHARADAAAGPLGFSGVQGAQFGEDVDALRQAWGEALAAMPEPGDPEACHYLFPAAESGKPYRIAFMIERGRFVRADVRSADIPAPGGGRVGDRIDGIRALYGRVEEQPHNTCRAVTTCMWPIPRGAAGCWCSSWTLMAGSPSGGSANRRRSTMWKAAPEPPGRRDQSGSDESSSPPSGRGGTWVSSLLPGSCGRSSICRDSAALAIR